MTDLGSEFTERAKSLLLEQRAHWTEQILATLDPQDGEIDAAWDDEIRRRINEIETGAVQAIPSELALAQVRQALRR